MPVTVGIARTRTLAKLISDTAKPFGALAVLDAEAEADLLADRPVTEITGIAGRRAARLMPWGIRTCLDLARADRRLVRSLLTASGEALWWELNGDPVQPIQPRRPPHKVLSRGGSLGEATADPIVLYAWLVRNLERLIEELEYHEVRRGPADGLGRLQERPRAGSARRRSRPRATASTCSWTRPAPASDARGSPGCRRTGCT